MHYCPTDRFRLADRVAERFPLCGAADVRVLDLIYGIEGDRYRYLFTAEYTLGTVSAKRRIRQAASFSEPRHRESPQAPSEVTLAPADRPLPQQYRYLAAAGAGFGPAPARA